MAHLKKKKFRVFKHEKYFGKIIWLCKREEGAFQMDPKHFKLITKKFVMIGQETQMMAPDAGPQETQATFT